MYRAWGTATRPLWIDRWPRFWPRFRDQGAILTAQVKALRSCWPQADRKATLYRRVQRGL